MNTALNRHRAGLLRKMENSNKRGAALILEIIIYLVIVALIAVAVTSGVRAIRDLVFTAHAKSDIQNIQTWMEGKYTQDNVYTATTITATPTGDQPTLTTANGVANTAQVTVANGASSGYCIKVVSNTISDAAKKNFWLQSENPSKIYQSGTANAGATSSTAPAALSVACPA